MSADIYPQLKENIKDIEGKEIYVDYSIVEFETCHIEFKGILRYSQEDSQYFIEVLSDDTGVRTETYGLVYHSNEFENIKIIDNIQQNKLGLI